MFFNIIEREIQKVWFGEVSLKRAFWFHKILIGGGLGIAMQVVFWLTSKTIASIFLAFYVVFHIWILKGLFACRYNCKKPQLFGMLIIIFISINIVIITTGSIMFLLPDNIKSFYFNENL